MTREEEIKLVASCHIADSIENYKEFYEGFIHGAKWADKHPKRYNQDELCDIQLEMMKQRDKRLIKKVCEWLEDCAVVDIEEFRKSMEE